MSCCRGVVDSWCKSILSCNVSYRLLLDGPVWFGFVLVLVYLFVVMVQLVCYHTSVKFWPFLYRRVERRGVYAGCMDVPVMSCHAM